MRQLGLTDVVLLSDQVWWLATVSVLPAAGIVDVKDILCDLDPDLSRKLEVVDRFFNVHVS